MNVGDVLDGAFRLLRARWRTMLLVAGAVVVPTQLLSSWFTRDVFSVSFIEMMENPVSFAEAMEAGSWVGDLVSVLYMVLLLPVITGALAWVAVRSALGQDPEWTEALKRALRRTWSLLVAWAVSMLLATIPAGVGVGLVVVAVISGSGLAIALGILLMLAGFFAALCLWTLFALALPVVTVEELGGVRAVRRSARLVRKRFWPVLGTYLLAALVTGLVSGALSGIPSWFAFVLGDYGWLMAAAGSMVGSLVTLPFLAIVLALLYLDARIRHEGLDLEIAADQLTTQRGGGALGG